jgi:hypothetical protein
MKATLTLLALIATVLCTTAAPKKSTFSKKQQTELIKLYEEEIMAHDLYVALGKVHPDIRPFQNIPHSEIMHRDALAAVMKEHKIKAPKVPKGRRFASEGLDEMFDKLLATGRKSPQAACEVGVGFEELDIAELRAAQKSIPAAKDTLVQLEWASGNHLRAFHRNLTARGGSYKATHLSKKDLKSILAGKGPEGANGCGAGNAGAGPQTGGCREGCESCAPKTGKGPGRGMGRGMGRGNGPGRNR